MECLPFFVQHITTIASAPVIYVFALPALLKLHTHYHLNNCLPLIKMQLYLNDCLPCLICIQLHEYTNILYSLPSLKCCFMWMNASRVWNIFSLFTLSAWLPPLKCIQFWFASLSPLLSLEPVGVPAFSRHLGGGYLAVSMIQSGRSSAICGHHGYSVTPQGKVHLSTIITCV